MLNRPSSQKIRPDHLDRLAVIYVRQSTLFQVRENTGSTTRQYDLVKRAQDLGWTPACIQVVDQDQGQSGASWGYDMPPQQAWQLLKRQGCRTRRSPARGTASRRLEGRRGR